MNLFINKVCLYLLLSQDQQEKLDKQKQKRQEIEKEKKKKEKEMILQGKNPYFLKKCKFCTLLSALNLFCTKFVFLVIPLIKEM